MRARKALTRASSEQRALAMEVLQRIRILNQRGKKDTYQHAMIGV